MNTADLHKIARLLRYWSLVSTTKAGSGHPTSCLSAADLMAALFFGGTFRCDSKRPDSPLNDHLIFSKGHASPLYYALWMVAGAIPESELLTLRSFRSRLEGHPTMRFPYTECATGSLGQGLSVGVGLALASRMRGIGQSRTYVLLGDSEMAEGSVWEAMQVASHYALGNLIAIVDMNGLGQRGPTMYRHNAREFAARVKAFGWDTIVADGHDMQELQRVFTGTRAARTRPLMIIARTVKGKGIRFLENAEGWHGRALDEHELESALNELGPVHLTMRGVLRKPTLVKLRKQKALMPRRMPVYQNDARIATRKAYGDAIATLGKTNHTVVALDAEVSNSTGADIFKKAYPDRFFEMFIAEQNMASVAVGMARSGYVPFASSFAAFLTRAADQIRMAGLSQAHVKFVGSHAGVSIGADGPSQMGLEDIALFRSIDSSVVLYPADAVATHGLVLEAAAHRGLVYLRTTREALPVLYPASQRFMIGGSKVVKQSSKDVATIVAAGITLHEALKAYHLLKQKKILVRVIDAYSVKPIDARTLRRAAQQTKHIISVEDHRAEGGLGEAVASVLAQTHVPITILAVRKTPRSGTPAELMRYEEIDAEAIIAAVEKGL